MRCPAAFKAKKERESAYFIFKIFKVKHVCSAVCFTHREEHDPSARTTFEEPGHGS